MSEYISALFGAAAENPWTATAVVAATAAALALRSVASAPQRRPFAFKPSGKREKGVVYLHMFPRWRSSPNPSPFCLRLEAFLRVAGIPYVAVQDQGATGPNGKMPWIELDGEALPDTELIMEELEDRFKLGLRPSATGHAVSVMFAERTNWVTVHNRWLRHTALIFRTMIKVPPPVQWIIRATVVPSVARSGWFHGVFRHSDDQMDGMMRRDLAAASELLGKADFFGGDRPDVADISVFAFVSNAVADDFPHPAKDWIRNDFSNLYEHFLRVRDVAFPDWDTVRKAPKDKVFRGGAN